MLLAVSARPRSPYRKASAMSRMRLRISYTVGATLKPQKDEDCAGVQLHNVQKCWRVLLTRCVKGARAARSALQLAPPANSRAEISEDKHWTYYYLHNAQKLECSPAHMRSDYDIYSEQYGPGRDDTRRPDLY